MAHAHDTGATPFYARAAPGVSILKAYPLELTISEQAVMFDIRAMVESHFDLGGDMGYVGSFDTCEGVWDARLTLSYVRVMTSC